MPTQPTPAFPDALYREHAAYLAAHTDLTPRESEAYLRRAHTPDEGDDAIPDRVLAEHMDVTKGTFSRLLSSARDKLEGNESILDSLTTLLHTTDFGGSGGPSRRVIAAKKTLNAFVLITTTEFYDADEYSFPDKYRAHFVYRDQEPAVDFDALPDDIAHYTKHSVFTVNADTPDQFATNVAAYIDALPALNEYDLVNTLDLIEDHLGVTDLPADAEDFVQDAAGDIMAREQQ